MIHVLFRFNDRYGKYSKFVGACLCSIFENTKSKITAHLIHDSSLSESNREKFETLAENYRQQVRFYNLDELVPDKLKWMRETAPQTQNDGDIYAIFAPFVLPPEISRIISLDADMIVNLDIAEIWNMNLEGKVLAAVPEGLINGGTKIGSLSNQFVVKNEFATSEEYFNFATMVIDLNKIRDKNDFSGGGGIMMHSSKNKLNAFEITMPDQFIRR